jgi:hypothetical protein
MGKIVFERRFSGSGQTLRGLVFKAAKEYFSDYETFNDHKETEKVIFHYCINEESHYYLGFSVKQKKVVEMINCW